MAPLPATVTGQARSTRSRFNPGANLSLASGGVPQTLTIGGAPGGAILALDTTAGNTVSGGIITAGANELDVHTVGNLTITSAITGGAGGTGAGLNKGESGTADLVAWHGFYNGQTIVGKAGTMNLAAGNNAMFTAPTSMSARGRPSI